MTTKFPNLKTPFVNREHVDDFEIFAAHDALARLVAGGTLAADEKFAAATLVTALGEVLRTPHPPGTGPSPLSLLVSHTLTVLKRQASAAAA